MAITPQSPLIPQYEDALYLFDLAGYVPSVFEKAVAIQNPAFQRPALTKLVDIFGKDAIQENIGNRLYNMGVQQNDYPSATIQTSTASGSNLVLTFTDTTFESFVQGNQIASISGALANIVSASPGTVTISCLVNSTGGSTFGGSDFLANETTMLMGMWGNTRDRAGATIQTSIPTKYQNVIGQFDGNCELLFDEQYTKTYFEFQGNMAYLSGKEYIALQKLYQAYYAYMCNDFPFINDAMSPKPATWINQIKTMGGFQTPLTGLMTLSQFKDVATNYIISSGLKGDRILIICGSQYAFNIGNILEPYVLTAGINNVVGGKDVKGISITNYGILSKQLMVITDPFFDNPRMWGVNNSSGFSNRSNSAIWMSPESVQVEGGGVLPPVIDKYFGVSNLMTVEVPGFIDRYGRPVKQGANLKKSCQIGYSLDKTTQITNCAMAMYHGN